MLKRILTHHRSTAVVRGVVFRAHNKDYGPRRITSCSYGFLICEPYDPELIPAHRGARPKICDVDGIEWIDDTIAWLIVKVRKPLFMISDETNMIVF